VKTVIKKLQYPWANVAYYLPTYSLIKDTAIPRTREILNLLGIAHTVNLSDKYIDVYNGPAYAGRILFRSMENRGENIVSYEVAYSLIDEADKLKFEDMKVAFVKIDGRNRAPIPGVNQLDFVGTPEGFGFMYDFFVRKASPKKKLIRARSYENPFLPREKIENWLETFDTRIQKAYIEGEFVNLTAGQVFHFYDRVRHRTDRTAEDFDMLHVGMDFNVGNMSAVVYGIERDTMYAVDELTGLENTFVMSEALRRRWPRKTIVVYPDASGRARHTSSSWTDIDILKRAGLKVQVPKSNPPVIDRVNETNLRLERGKLLVNDARAVTLAEAFEKLTWKNGKPDKSSGLDHIVDAATYPVWWHRKRKFEIQV
jgi:hypothetical protein